MVQAEIRDATHPVRVLFTWKWLGEKTSWGVPIVPLVEVTLECSWAFQVTATVSDPSIGQPLLAYLEEIGSLEGDWEGERTFKSLDENLVITSLWCYQGRIALEVSLDADNQDPVWTIQVRPNVEQAQWPEIIRQFRQFFAAASERP